MSAAAVLFSFVWAVVVAPFSILLLIVAGSLDGRVFACAALLAGVGPWVLSYGCLKNRRRWIYSGWASLGVCAGFGLFLASRAPVGSSGTSSKVHHIYSGENAGFRRFAIGNLLPEADQLSFGYALMTVIDPLLTLPQAQELRRLTMDIYGELERDGSFHELGSAMPDVYTEAVGGRIDRGHAYLYIPASIDRSKPAPVLVFFHGSGGNFKAYTWLLSKLAERLGAVLIAPSNGMGDWSHVQAGQVLDQALREASKTVVIDQTRVDVVGLSNGGLAVSQLLTREAWKFRSFVFISPVFDTELLGEITTPTAKGSATVYVLTGQQDDRIPLTYVANQVSRLKRRGVDATVKVLDGANHFLFFSHRNEAIEQMHQWLRE
jgi:pimeloyl-ACP methyl ester carboxylesterase